MQQLSFQKTHWKHRFSHGGTLRQKRPGRGQRPLSVKEPLHLVLKAHRECLKSSGFRSYRRFFLIHQILQRYALKFFIKVEQVSIQGDHIHLLIRSRRRSNYQAFFRVFSGQIAQRFQQEGLLSVALTQGVNSKSALQAVTDTPQGIHPTEEAEMRMEMRRRSDGDEVKNEEANSPRLLKLWKYRPYSRVVRGWRAYQIVRDYIQLNEKEGLWEIPYRKLRLRGLSTSEWALLWGEVWGEVQPIPPPTSQSNLQWS